MEILKLDQYCKLNKKEYLLTQWCFTRNEPDSPESVDYASHKQIWWKCEKGHFWTSQLKDRSLMETGCPYCSGKKVQSGFNDLLSQNPEIAKEWHPTKNKGMNPGEISAGSAKKVWWKCEKGHEWQAAIENRALKGTACPYCKGKKAWPGFNDLETLFPQTAKEWHPSLNTLSPQQVRPGSGRMVWWQCQEGHEWKARVFSRTSNKNAGCPICAGRQNTKK